MIILVLVAVGKIAGVNFIKQFQALILTDVYFHYYRQYQF